MTTTVTVNVGGRYIATVVQDDRDPVVIDGSYGGDAARKSFTLGHPANSTFRITEEALPEKPAAAAETNPAPEADKTA